MDLLKYLLVGGGSLLLGIILVFITKNLLSGILIFMLLFGSFILLNVVKDLNKEPPQKNPPVPQQQ